jgi:predicted nucleic acid-binding protein
VKLLDTSVAVDHLRGDSRAVGLLRGLVLAGEAVGASEIVRFELLAGVRERERVALERFCSALSWIPVDESVARAAGALARRHRKAHVGIDAADYLIAATTLLLEADLLTTNVKHFPMISRLRSAY